MAGLIALIVAVIVMILVIKTLFFVGALLVGLAVAVAVYALVQRFVSAGPNDAR